MSALMYDPSVIEEHARRLNRRADAMGATAGAVGAVIGGFFGAVPLTSLGAAWPIPSQFGLATVLLGALVGGLLGFTVGNDRAFGCRLQAQDSLCRLQLEQNTAALLSISHSDAGHEWHEPPAAHRAVPAEPAREPASFAEPDPYAFAEPDPYAFVEQDPRAQPAPFAEPVPVAQAAHFAEPDPIAPPAPFAQPGAPLPDLASMSLEEIARLANSGLIS